MGNLTMYLESVEGQVKADRKKRESKIEKSILELSQRLVAESKPCTVKAVVEAGVCKTTQQVHQTLKRATLIKKAKVGDGRDIVIVPADMN
jgi:hypothetical protein